MKNPADSTQPDHQSIHLKPLVTEISKAFVRAPFNQLNTVFLESLKRIGTTVGVERVSVFQFNDDQSSVSHRFEWNQEGIEAVGDRLRNLDITAFPRWMEAFKTLQPIRITDVSRLTPEQTFETSGQFTYNAKSALILPLSFESKLIGFVDLISVNQARTWSDPEVEALSEIAELCAFGLNRLSTEARLDASLDRLYRNFVQLVESFGTLISHNDPFLMEHQHRVAELAEAIALKMDLPKTAREAVYFAAMLHDIGQLYIPAQIINKTGRLTPTEYGLVKTHPNRAKDILSAIDFPWPVTRIVTEHHERMDGSGYPEGKLGEELLIESKILAVADTVEAMLSDRPYRKAHDLSVVLEELSSKRGRTYDPAVVHAVLSLLSDGRFTFTMKAKT